MAARAKAPRRTGCLQESIVKRVEFGVPSGFIIRIVCDTTPCSPTRTSYSLFVHEGTQPHAIYGNPTLSFWWDAGPNGPGQYFFSSVQHPGTRPQPFLRDALPLAAG
jgi:hypothetical protein